MSKQPEIVKCPNCHSLDAKRFGDVIDCYSCKESFKLTKTATEEIWQFSGPIDTAISELPAGVDETDNVNFYGEPVEEAKEEGWAKRNWREFVEWII